MNTTCGKRDTLGQVFSRITFEHRNVRGNFGGHGRPSWFMQKRIVDELA